MKRDARLQGLSRDHHQALVLARTIERRCHQNDVDEDFLASVRHRFHTELAPHFAIEETLLAALLGEEALVRRTREEHALMARLLDAATPEGSAPLREFSRLLADHVRFEERDLYPACETKLSSATLDHIAVLYSGGS